MIDLLLCRNGIFHRDVKPENILIRVGFSSLAKIIIGRFRFSHMTMIISLLIQVQYIFICCIWSQWKNKLFIEISSIPTIYQVIILFWFLLFQEDVLKLADFGSCRSVYSKQPYTEYISTRWSVFCTLHFNSLVLKKKLWTGYDLCLV